MNYRYLKKIKGIVSKNNKEYIDEFDMYVRYLNLDVKVYFKRFHNYMIANKKMKSTKTLRNTLPIKLTSCTEMYDQILKVLKSKPYFLLKKNPCN